MKSPYIKLFVACGRVALKTAGEIKDSDVAEVLALASNYLDGAQTREKGERYVLAGIALLWCDAYLSKAVSDSFLTLHMRMSEYVKMAGRFADDRETAAQDRAAQRQSELFV